MELAPTNAQNNPNNHGNEIQGLQDKVTDLEESVKLIWDILNDMKNILLANASSSSSNTNQNVVPSPQPNPQEPPNLKPLVLSQITLSPTPFNYEF